MGMARLASQRSTCSRLNVGALVTYHNNPVAVGYNGAPPGEPHCSGNSCPGMTPGGCPTIHAEVNALNKARLSVISGEKVDLYVTHSPCESCLHNLMTHRLSVGRLFFEIPYRDTTHLKSLLSPYPSPVPEIERKTEVYEVTPAGYIVEYFSRRVVELP